MYWKKAISFGLLIWILMFVIVSILMTFKIYDFVWGKIIAAIIAGIIALILAGKLKPNSLGVALVYGLIWVAVGLILDALVTMRFNPAIFGLWSLWLGYILIVFATLLRIKKQAELEVEKPNEKPAE